jgi:hypothetical protein
LKEDVEDTKGAIRFRSSKKNRQHNGQKKKYKRVVQGIRMAQNIEESFDASSAHKMHVLIANFKRYVCVHLIMVAFESCYNIDLYRYCRTDVVLAQLLFYLYNIIVSVLLAMVGGISMHRFI